MNKVEFCPVCGARYRSIYKEYEANSVLRKKRCVACKINVITVEEIMDDGQGALDD